MRIEFRSATQGTTVHQIESDDVAGIIASVEWKSIYFPQGHYKYNDHALSHYLRNGEWGHELIIFIDKV